MKAWDMIKSMRQFDIRRWVGRRLQNVRALFWKTVLRMPWMPMIDRAKIQQPLGNRGELAAERYLLRLGYIVLFRSYEDKFGEIDLIAVDGETIVFVEVKTRTSDHAGDPAEAVDAAKQLHLTKTGIGFLKWHRLTDYSARFDVVAILGSPLQGPIELQHYINAFEPAGEFQMFG